MCFYDTIKIQKKQSASRFELGFGSFLHYAPVL
jgi:hypothetical protein